MYRFLITIGLRPATPEILVRAPDGHKAARAEHGCVPYDFFTCTDNTNPLVFAGA